MKKEKASIHGTIDDQGCKREAAWCSSHPSHPTMGGSVITKRERRYGHFSTHLIMTPTQQNVVQSTVWLVNTILGRVHGIPRVWVVLERVWVNDLVRELAPDDKSISDHVPLALRSKEEQKFSQVVNQSGYLHPFRFAVASHGLGGLQ